MARTRMTQRPADECPYPRPFPPDFRECPAYRTQRLLPMDSRYRPLKPERTCAHMEVGTGTAGRFYACCAVGTAGERIAWAAARAQQLAELDAVQREMTTRTAALSDQVWMVKGRQLRAFATGDVMESAAATRELRAETERLLAGMEAVLEERHTQLRTLGLSVDVCMDLLRNLTDRWVEQRTAEPPEITDADLRRFPKQAWWLVRPGARDQRQASDQAPRR